MGHMESHLRARRDGGAKLLVPYVTGGYPGWEDAIRAAADAGADAIEIGIPFSDPVMDGPVIQQASQAALDDGATPAGVLQAVPDLDTGVPHAVMTYYNLCHHAGHERFALLSSSGGVLSAVRAAARAPERVTALIIMGGYVIVVIMTAFAPPESRNATR